MTASAEQSSGHGSGHSSGRGVVTALSLYPVKSLSGVACDELAIEPWGPAGDRRWCLVEEDGTPLTARAVPALLRLIARPVPRGVAILDPADRSEISVAEPDSAPVPIGLSRLSSARPADEAANAWLSRRAGRPVRLVWQSDPRERAMNPDRGGHAGESLSLADAGPLLLCSQASLDRLNDSITLNHADPVPMQRFRPNVVVAGLEPFVEESWRSVRIGRVDFRVTMHCDRCVMTMIDPPTGRRGPEPTRTLAATRRRDGRTWFGVRLIADPEPGANPTEQSPVISVGDQVRGAVGTSSAAG